MDARAACSSCGRERETPLGPCPGCGADDESLVAGWVALEEGEGAAPPPMPHGGGECPSCGYVGELVDGPESTACPACGAEYPKGSGWTQVVRCPNCNQAIAITNQDQERERTIVCSRCKCFLGRAPRLKPTETRETAFDWIRRIPTWAWLALAGWQVIVATEVFRLPDAAKSRLACLALVGFLALAACRARLWKDPAPQREG